MRRLRLLGVLSLLAVACSHEDQQGVGEPFRVTYKDPSGKKHDAQFIAGALPGYRADAGPAGPPPGADAGLGPARVLRLSYTGAVFYQGEGDRPVEVRATENAASVGIRIADVGSGYWVVPAGILDDVTRDMIEDVSFDFSNDIESRYHDLLLVALDGNGNAGPWYEQPICVASRVPDSFNSCRQTGRMPKAVISLSWDTNADLDLQVMTPEGVLVDPKNPFTVVPDGGPLPSDIGTLDRDSNASCRIDGIRREDLVWLTTMPHGRYDLYVNMYASCGQPAARFELDVYSAVDVPDGGHYLDLFASWGGELLDISANGGAARGLYVNYFQFQ